MIKDIFKRMQTAREPFRHSKVYEEARAHNALLDAEDEIERLREIEYSFMTPMIWPLAMMFIGVAMLTAIRDVNAASTD